MTDDRFTVRSRYVIGADGGQSRVAETIGLAMDGQPGLGPALNIHLRADLTSYVAHRPGSVYWILQPNREGFHG